MKQLCDDLWKSERYSTGIQNTQDYLLPREQGNILLYNTGNTADLDHIEDLSASPASTPAQKAQ